MVDVLLVATRLLLAVLMSLLLLLLSRSDWLLGHCCLLVLRVTSLLRLLKRLGDGRSHPTLCLPLLPPFPDWLMVDWCPLLTALALLR